MKPPKKKHELVKNQTIKKPVLSLSKDKSEIVNLCSVFLDQIQWKVYPTRSAEGRYGVVVLKWRNSFPYKKSEPFQKPQEEEAPF